MSDFGTKLFGSKLKYGLGAALLLSVALAWGVTITLTDASGNTVNCTTSSDITVRKTSGDIVANVDGTTTCNLSGTSTPPPSGNFALTVNTNGGTGTGTVNCNSGTGCASTYTAGSTVTLVATGTGGSTFAGWSGDCNSGNSTGGTCTLVTASTDTITSYSVTAAFTAPVSTGGDPGTNPWINGTTYVHNRGSLGELFVPRCIHQYTNCRNGGSQSAYDTVLAGQAWAMRIPFGSTSSTSNFVYSLAREDSLSVLTVYDMAISTVPNDFSSTNANCAKFNSSAMTIRVHDSTAVPNPSPWWGSCPLARNTRYYLNVRPAAGTTAATACGNSSANACRYKIILPAVPSGFYTD